MDDNRRVVGMGISELRDDWDDDDDDDDDRSDERDERPRRV